MPRLKKAALGIFPALFLGLALVWAAAGTAWAASPAEAAAPPSQGLTKLQVAGVLDGRLNSLVDGRPFLMGHPKLGSLLVEPTIDPRLQKAAESWINGNRDKGVALVAVEVHTGRVLVLAGVYNRRLDPELALRTNAPAASLFKVVTAAAALEEADMQPQSTVGYVGGPHTLYKSQVEKKLPRRAQEVTLKKSFGQSNNAVFARLGIFHLGEDVLTRYARGLGFGRPLRLEQLVGTSCLVEPTDKFSLGEMACGYNRITSTSPLHAALMMAAFVGSGRLPEPFMVRRVMDSKGRVLYLGRPSFGPQVTSPSTCRDMRRLMEATVSTGTARNAFKGYNKDRVLKELDLGGKTGTIRGMDRKYLYEWFAGYGENPLTGRAVAVTAMSIHGNRRYTNSKALARKLIREIFAPQALADGGKKKKGKKDQM